MLRELYLQLLRAHPATFRRRFGDEMLEAFDLTRGRQEHLDLLLDATVSLARQWVLRTDFHKPWQPAAAPVAAAYEPITFQQIEPYKPRGAALAQGGLVAVLLLFGVVDAINHGGNKLRTLAIGMHRPGFGLIKINRADFEGQPLVAAEAARDLEDPLRPFLRSYARIVHALAVLDADGDLTISAAEIANAPAALRTLDLNHDGRLSAQECGFEAPRYFPLRAALDTNHDGVISAAEIANASASLKSLDIDNDGNLSPYELLPHPAVSEAAALITRFDLSDSGVISIQGLPKEDPDLEVVRQILMAADRNRDGVVTRGELTIELARRSAVAEPRSFQ
jgi:Ca2+-binding EF-hand superfamily protein